MTLEYESRLDEVTKQIKDGIKPQPVTARTFIGWFGAKRRTSWQVGFIRSKLKKFQLTTSPDFEHTYIDSLVALVSATNAQGEEEIVTDVQMDPTYRIGKLASANHPPISVKPDDEIATAVTLMITNDYSQLPVMTSNREVKGMITWTSLGTRLALGKECKYVRDCMVPHKETSSDAYIFSTVNDIIANQYVLIRNSENIIAGIVTTSDLGLQFRQLGEPFLLLGEIENYIRRMLLDKFTIDELNEVADSADSERKIESVSNLTLGEYIRLIENPKHWEKLEISAVDRKVFIKELEQIREIRNDVMHFDPDGIAEEDLYKLRSFVNLLQTLAQVGII